MSQAGPGLPIQSGDWSSRWAVCRRGLILTRVFRHLALDQPSAVLLIEAAGGENDPSRGGVKEVRSQGVNNADGARTRANKPGKRSSTKLWIS